MRGTIEPSLPVRLPQQLFDFGFQPGKQVADKPPDSRMVHQIVAVREEVPEVDDGSIVADPQHQLWFGSLNAPQCLADNLELALDASAKPGIIPIVVQRLIRSAREDVIA